VVRSDEISFLVTLTSWIIALEKLHERLILKPREQKGSFRCSLVTQEPTVLWERCMHWEMIRVQSEYQWRGRKVWLCVKQYRRLYPK